MSSKTTSWILELVDKITSPLHNVQGAADDTADSVERVGQELDEASESGEKLNGIAAEFGAKAFLFGQAADGIAKFNGYFRDSIAPGVQLETQMAKLSTISGKTGAELKALENQARDLGREFGVGASAMTVSFMDTIGSLGDSFGESEEALAIMGRNIGTLSKLMDGDAKGAANALSTAMLQYGVDLNKPIEAACEATRMMNVMQAAANVGGSEVVDTAEALRQSGLLAKQSGLSFEELNASLEGLAKGKIVAGEAGTAMRNILLSMSTLGNSPKQVIEGLQAYGVNVEMVADPTVKFTDRLRELQKIQNDPGLMESIFMKANIAAGQTILNNIDTIDEWTGAITGTNAAVEGAAVIMDTYEEKMARSNATIDNFKASVFDAMSPIAPFISLSGDAVSGVADLGVAVWGLSVLFKKDLYTGIFTGIKAAVQWTTTNVIGKTAIIATTIATKAWTAAQWLLNAAFIASPIGWIVVGIGALVGAVVLCWNKFEGFRGTILGMWEVLKGFGNILKDFVIDRITGLLNGIGSIGKALASLFSRDFKAAWQHTKDGIRGISGIDAVRNAAESTMSLGNAFEQGYADGVASFQADKERKEGKGVFEISKPGASIGAKSITGGTTPVVKPLNQPTGGTGSKNNLGTGGTGSGKSVTMNVTLNITNHGVNDPDKFTEQIVRKINDRLNDNLSAAS